MEELEKLDQAIELAKISLSKLVVHAIESGAGSKRVESVGEALANVYETQKTVDEIKAIKKFEKGFSDVLNHFG